MRVLVVVLEPLLVHMGVGVRLPVVLVLVLVLDVLVFMLGVRVAVGLSVVLVLVGMWLGVIVFVHAPRLPLRHARIPKPE